MTYSTKNLQYWLTVPRTTDIRTDAVTQTQNKNLQSDVNSYLHLTNDSYMTVNETDKQTKDRSKITAKQQSTNHCNFQVLTTNHYITTKLTNPKQDHSVVTTSIDSEDDYRSGSRNVSRQQQSF